MSNLGVMVAEIAADLRRSSMSNDIKNSIAAGAAFFRSRRLWFNEKTFTFSTVISQEYYTSTDSTNIPLVARFDLVKFIDGQLEYDLNTQSTDWIDQQNIGSNYRSQPTDYAYTRQSIRLFPIPNAASKTIRVNGILESIDTGQVAAKQRMLRTNVLTLPDAYASDWFTDDVAYQVLKAWAKGDLLTHKLGNQQSGASFYALANDMASTGKSQAQDQGGGRDFVEASNF